MSAMTVPATDRARARRLSRRDAIARRAYLAACAAVDTPPRTRRLTPGQARRYVNRHLGATA